MRAVKQSIWEALEANSETLKPQLEPHEVGEALRLAIKRRKISQVAGERIAWMSHIRAALAWLFRHLGSDQEGRAQLWQAWKMVSRAQGPDMINTRKNIFNLLLRQPLSEEQVLSLINKPVVDHMTHSQAYDLLGNSGATLRVWDKVCGLASKYYLIYGLLEHSMVSEDDERMQRLTTVLEKSGEQMLDDDAFMLLEKKTLGRSPRQWLTLHILRGRDRASLYTAERLFSREHRPYLNLNKQALAQALLHPSQVVREEAIKMMGQKNIGRPGPQSPVGRRV